MKRKGQNELKIIFITLSAIAALAIVLAVSFAVLYFTKSPSLPTGSFGGETAETADDVIEALESENGALRAEAESLADALESVREEQKAEETEHAPADSVDISGTFDPGDITPADPDSLSYTFDLTAQLRALSALEAQMESSPFLVDGEGSLVKIEDITVDGNEEVIYRARENSPLDDDGKPTEVEIDWEAMGYTRPRVALSYRDLERGTVYAYNGDEVYFSASLIKVPYIYTLLLQFAEYNEIKAANPTNDPEKGKTLSDEILEKYDLNRKITVTEAMVAEGSGTIQDMNLSGAGKEFTVLELIEYTIKVSDNTAFSVLRQEFGYNYFQLVSNRLGIKSIFTSFNKLTVNEACIYLAAIYDFAKEYPTEGGMLIALMKAANHRVVIPSAVDDASDVAHKYGWDENAYHDMAIVYRDAPFAVCIMTNFNFGRNDDDVNGYLRALVAGIEDVHLAFYADGN